MTKTQETVDKLVDALLRQGTYAYTTGYLSAYLAQIIDRYVPEDKKTELRIEILGDACNQILKNR
jgi:RecJ-like exonuclease